MGLLTGEIVTDLVKDGYSAAVIASTAAFWVGIYSLVLGLLRLGFLLDFIPASVLSGYVSGAAITILLQQLKGLFGQSKTGSDTAGVIRYFFHLLPQTKWRDFLIGFSGLIIIFGLQFIGRRWGKRYRALWYLSVARNALVLVLFTVISWAVNRHQPSAPLFSISKVTGTGILPPKAPDTDLLTKVAGRSIAVFLAAALEHLAIGKAFGRHHGYVIDQDQELNFIGLVNLFGSFFSCMPITGGFSRTAVNSESGVKSPLSGLATTACVLVSIYKLSDAFYWIPSATLSAVIVAAVWQIVLPARVFWAYWKVSFADFFGSMVTFWITLFVSVEIGIACGVGYSLVYILLHLAFTKVMLVDNNNLGKLYPSSKSSTEQVQRGLPDDTMLFMLQDSILYPNATRISRQICDYIYTYTAGIHEQSASLDNNPNHPTSRQRLWNDTRTHHVARLRHEASLNQPTSTTNLRLLNNVILDLTRATHIDTTGLQALDDMRNQILDWAGPHVSIRIVGANKRVRDRFERHQLSKINADKKVKGQRDGPLEAGYQVFELLQDALAGRRGDSEEGLVLGEEDIKGV
jgi:sodium-independent sulfate anion transporter 11